MTLLPPRVWAEVEKNASLYVRSVHFKAVIDGARQWVAELDRRGAGEAVVWAELAAYLVAGLAMTCGELQKQLDGVARLAMGSRMPLADLLETLRCDRSSPAAGPTASPPPPRM